MADLIESTWTARNGDTSVTVWCAGSTAAARCDTCLHTATARHADIRVARVDVMLTMDAHHCWGRP